LYINEFSNMIFDNCERGIQLSPELIELFLLLFADDIVLFSDTVHGLQTQLDILYDYCQAWKLSLNMSKTKIVVFRRGGRLCRYEQWNYGNDKLLVVSEYNYLGILFSSRLSLTQSCNQLAIKGKRALMEVLRTMSVYGNIPHHIYFKIFDTQIKPILLYGAELWGFQRYEVLERIQTLACKRYLKLGRNTPSLMVLGECGRLPIYYNSLFRCIKYWTKLLRMPNNRYPRKAYCMLYNLDIAQRHTWATSVKKHIVLIWSWC
jgi:hypothetical protein